MRALFTALNLKKRPNDLQGMIDRIMDVPTNGIGSSDTKIPQDARTKDPPITGVI